MNNVHESVWAAIAAQNPRAAAVLASTSRTGRDTSRTAAVSGRASAVRVARAWHTKVPQLAVARAMRDAGMVLKTPAASRDRVMHRLGFVGGSKRYGRWNLFITQDSAVLTGRGGTLWTFSREVPPDGMTTVAGLNDVVRRAWDVVFGPSRENRGPFRFGRYGARLNATTLLPSANEYRRLVEQPRKTPSLRPRLAMPRAARKSPPR